jgi:hypothetical protein
VIRSDESELLIMNVSDVLAGVPSWSSSPDATHIADAVADGVVAADDAAAHAGTSTAGYLATPEYREAVELRRRNGLSVAVDADADGM